MKKQLILAGGLPGSGKTTFAQGIKHWLGRGIGDARAIPFFKVVDMVVVVSADDYHINDVGEYEWKQENLAAAHKACKDRVREAMASETPVIIVHNTFTRLLEREEYRVMAEEAGYQVHDLVMLNTHGHQNVHGVPAEKLKQMAHRIELPLYPKPEHVPGYGKSLVALVEHLRLVPQAEVWHPEGNVLNHTLIVLVRALETGIPELVWTAFFHDLGKIETTRYHAESGKITAYGHEELSVQYWDRFQHLAPDTLDKDMVRWLIAQHMKLKYELSPEKRLALEMEPTWFAALELFNTLDTMPSNWRRHLDMQGQAWEWIRENLFNNE